MIITPNKNNLTVGLIFLVIKRKNVSLCWNKSTVAQHNATIIAKEKGIQSMLYENDKGILPCNSASVARPIPQPGQGIPVMSLKKQTVKW